MEIFILKNWPSSEKISERNEKTTKGHRHGNGITDGTDAQQGY